MSPATIADRYELGDRLGSGGMSTVYQATDRVLERTVAVKVLAEHLSDDEKFVARFRREALAVAKLVHPNIVQVYDTGVDAGRHFIVMEYVEGRPARSCCSATARCDPATAVEIAAQACAGLEYAHRQGIIHRDVKPGNLMVIGGPAGGPPEMTVKLADFGIARAAEQTRLTQVGSVVGTAAYLSPEQSRGEEATPISDVYSLGVVIYQLLTAPPPLRGQQPRRARDPPRERAAAAADQLRAGHPRGALAGGPAGARERARGPLRRRARLGAALRAGLSGIAPADRRRRRRIVDGDSTAATRVAPARAADPDLARPAPARPRRSPPPRAAAPVRVRRAADPQALAASRSFMRGLGAILLIAIVAGADRRGDPARHRRRPEHRRRPVHRRQASIRTRSTRHQASSSSDNTGQRTGARRRRLRPPRARRRRGSRRGRPRSGRRRSPRGPGARARAV